MRISVSSTPLQQVQADWIIVPVWENEPLGGLVQDLDQHLEGKLSRLLERGDHTGKARETTPLFDLPGLSASRVMLAGLGPRAKIDVAGLVGSAAAAAKAITGKEYKKLVLAVPDPVDGLPPETMAWALGIGVQQGSEGPGIRKTKPGRFTPAEVELVGRGDSQAAREQGAKRAETEGRAVSLARELVNLPPCELYPETFAQRAQAVAQETGINCEIWDEHRLASENMNALLAVARGSNRPARLVVLRYQGKPGGKTLGLVGKGVTFDSGGLSLKPNDGMVDMKCDMAGGAAVLAAFQAIAQQKLPVNLLGIIALVENLPSGKALKLGDVLKARNGKTIEVLNTDAEGRLILADALAYAVEAHVDHLVDLATLTGACMVALGLEVAGLMSNHEEWSQKVLAAIRASGERAWPLPMDAIYNDLIKSDVADMKNTGGGRWAGAIAGAKFLEEFVGSTPWVHLDIAGPAWAEKESSSREAGGTGCMVRALVELARRYQ